MFSLEVYPMVLDLIKGIPGARFEQLTQPGILKKARFCGGFGLNVKTTTWSLRDCITKCRTKCLVLTRDEMLSSEVYTFQNIKTSKDLGPFAHFRGVLGPCWSEMYGAWHLFRCECHIITDDSH